MGFVETLYNVYDAITIEPETFGNLAINVLYGGIVVSAVVGGYIGKEDLNEANDQNTKRTELSDLIGGKKE